MSNHELKFDQELDARGLACPMPIVRARQELGKLQEGEVLRVVTTDRGSVRDFQGWAKASKAIELIAQKTEDEQGRELFVHYVRKTE